MRRTGRLGINSLGRHLEPLDTEETNSASLAKAEREIKRFKLENHKLKTDLNDIRSLYNQLIQENTHERFDERRVTLLKSQVIQLERQVLLLSEALSCRGDTLMEVENSLTWLADKCRSYVCMETRGPQVPIDRSDLTLMIETAESARIKLYKQVENRSIEKLSKPLKFYNEFIQPSRVNDVTWLDVASGNLEHLNLKHVTKLETKLSNLYKEMIHLHGLMEQETNNDSAYLWTSCHVTKVARERLNTRILKSCALMKDCTGDLLDLSLLFPSAPLPALKTNAIKDITAERVLKCLPSVPRSRSREAQIVIQALVKVYNYRVYMQKTQIDSLKDEIKYNQKVYNLQLKYTESLFQAIREGYSSFEETSNEVIVKPLRDILDVYVDLSRSASEKSLKIFLATFKQNASQLNEIVETLAVKAFEESEGSKELSKYGDEFFTSLESLVKEQQTKRDREAAKSDDLQEEQAKLDWELRAILEEQDRKSHDSMLTSSVVGSVNDESSNSLYTNMMSSRNDENTFRQEDIGVFGREKTQLGINMKNARSEYENSEDPKPKPKRQSNGNSSSRVIHKQEWVGVVEVEKGLTELSLENEKLTEPSDQDLMEYHRKTELENFNLSQTERSDSSKQGDSSISMESPVSSEKPPIKVKKKLNYVPNTFVPNRTLQLRRSGSLTRLSSADKMERNFENMSASETGRGQLDDVKMVSVKQRGHRSLSRDNSNPQLPHKSKPAFR